jgi:hypothetical protein
MTRAASSHTATDEPIRIAVRRKLSAKPADFYDVAPDFAIHEPIPGAAVPIGTRIAEPMTTPHDLVRKTIWTPAFDSDFYRLAGTRFQNNIFSKDEIQQGLFVRMRVSTLKLTYVIATSILHQEENNHGAHEVKVIEFIIVEWRGNSEIC